jgi:hypothetical protein
MSVALISTPTYVPTLAFDDPGVLPSLDTKNIRPLSPTGA